MSDTNDAIRSPEDAKAAVRSSLRTIKVMCDAYDEGHYEIARDLATVIHRLVTDELSQTKLRRTLDFVSYSAEPNPRNLLMQYLASIIQARVQSDGGHPTITITHKPMLDEMAEAIGQPTIRPFNEWWNGPALIWGAVDGPLIPTNEALHTPFAKRYKLSKFNIIDIVRNKMGAHYSRSVNDEMRRVEEKAIVAMDIAIAIGVNEYSYLHTPEIFVFTNNRAQAIVRHIAYEIMQSAEQWPFIRTS